MTVMYQSHVLSLLNPNTAFSRNLALQSVTLLAGLSKMHSSYFSVATYATYDPVNHTATCMAQWSAVRDTRNVTNNTTT